MPTRHLIAAAALLAPHAGAQGLNEQTFYNKTKTQFATRATTTETDTILFTQPLGFRNNGTLGSGWRVVIQDQQQATSEEIVLSWHNLASDGITPLPREIVKQKYLLFGFGKDAAAYIFTLQATRAIPLPQSYALGVVLPKPHPWAADVTLLQYQRGDNTRVAPAKRLQVTYKIDPRSGNVVKEWVVGSTFYWGGLYTGPMLQTYAVSKAYGPVEELFGPESLAPDPTRGDFVGFWLAGDNYKTLLTQPPSFAVLHISTGYSPFPLPTPYGPILVNPPLIPLFPLLMDRQGTAKVGPFPVPSAPFEAGLQAAFLNFLTNQIEFSNAALLSIK